MKPFIAWFVMLVASCAPAAESRRCTGLMALKLAETGSTWFASLLEATPAYKIEEEIYTGGSRDSDVPISKKEKTLKKVLSCDFLHSQRDVQGFTINPKNSIGVDWAAVVRATNAYVVTWKRSNLIKTVVSLYRKSVQQVCGGGANIRDGNNVSCVNEKVKIDIDKFVVRLQKQAHFYAELGKASFEASNAANGRNISMYYEDMQTDQQREMDKLAEFLGNTNYSHKHVVSHVVKKTSDDLKDIIINYDNVVKGLTKLNIPVSLNCPLVDMFRETEFKVFYGCDHEGLAKYLNSIGIGTHH